jgi:hypothetical protein
MPHHLPPPHLLSQILLDNAIDSLSMATFRSPHALGSNQNCMCPSRLWSILPAARGSSHLFRAAALAPIPCMQKQLPLFQLSSLTATCSCAFFIPQQPGRPSSLIPLRR